MRTGVWKETGEHWGLAGREKGCPRKEAGETDYRGGMRRGADVFHLLGDRPRLVAPCQQGGWTAELGEAASGFGGWEEGETAQTPAGVWSEGSIAGLAGARAASCTSRSRRLDGNVAVMVCLAACPTARCPAPRAPKPE